MQKAKVMPEKELEKEIKLLQKENQRLNKTLNTLSAYQTPKEVSIPCSKNTFTFGLIGDTHLGSLYERLDNLEAFYKYCKTQGVKDILHAGDIIDGHGIYKGQEFELGKVGWDAQYNHFVSDYPAIDGVTTHFITGNHDQSFAKSVGINPGAHFAQGRSDFNFVGEESGQVSFKLESGRKVTVALAHPGGGSAYSLSYKPQKIIESIAGGTKPHIIGIGHFHKAELIPNYRNVCGIQTGTFQAQTPFMLRNGLQAMVGGWLISITIGIGCNNIKSEFIAFY